MRRALIVSILAAVLIAMAIICSGCSKTYYGSFITTKVKTLPIEEFQAGDHVVLAFENPKKPTAEGWEYEFWAYKNRELVGNFRFQARLVAGTRNFYLVEEIPGARANTIASFKAKPNYDRIKERLVAYLNGEG